MHYSYIFECSAALVFKLFKMGRGKSGIFFKLVRKMCNTTGIRLIVSGKMFQPYFNHTNTKDLTISCKVLIFSRRGSRIRTYDPLLPKQVR